MEEENTPFPLQAVFFPGRFSLKPFMVEPPRPEQALDEAIFYLSQSTLDLLVTCMF